MGADLYIESLYHYDRATRKFVGDEERGYFRDSYNNTSVLRAYGLSWWQDVGPLVDEEGYLQPAQIIELKGRLQKLDDEDLPDEAEMRDDPYAEQSADGKIDGGTVQEWHDYYREKKERLLAFLDRALALNEPIKCSC